MSNIVFEELYKMKGKDKVDRMFDMVCAVNYFAGQYQQNMPVDESRKVFDQIKKILSKTNSIKK